MKQKVALVVGRWNPPHWGHILFMLWLLREEKFDRLIICIGSCYTVGTNRHPLLAFLREKMIAFSLEFMGVDMDKISFVHVPDFEDDWIGWWECLVNAPGADKATHLVTGNYEMIISKIEELKIKHSFEIINPEILDVSEDYKFGYHSTGMRNAYVAGDYEMFKNLAAPGTYHLMAHAGGSAGMREAMDDKGVEFIPGRQAVDFIMTCKGKGRDLLVLCGYRNKKEPVQFHNCLVLPGGGIDPYENPIDATVREAKEETNILVEVVNRSLEPTHVIVHGNKGPIITEMKFVKLFSTKNSDISGDSGGSSQPFCIHLDCGPEEFDGIIESSSDLRDVVFRPLSEVLEKGLAFQQDDMLIEALKLI